MQSSFEFPLTDFEQATLEQLVSYKIGKNKNETDDSVNNRIEEMLKSEKLIAEAKVLVNKWATIRKQKSLKPYK